MFSFDLVQGLFFLNITLQNLQLSQFTAQSRFNNDPILKLNFIPDIQCNEVERYIIVLKKIIDKM